MLKDSKREEKTCLFFASDYHFEMISLPYIRKKLDDEKEIVMISENSLNESINELLEKINLNSKEKEKFLKIDWENNDISKLKNNQIDGKNTVVFVKGNEKFIDNINNEIDCNKLNCLEVINCYDINEVQKNVKNIVERYGNVLSTSGIEKLI